MDNFFENKVALVTGASRGIGQAIALELGKLGATVIGTATTENGVESIQRAFKENKVKGRGCILDVANPDSVQQLFSDIENTMPNILVNNAGITADSLFLRMKESDWTRVIDTNLTGTYRLIQMCLKSMLKDRWGRIVNIGSVVGSTGNGGQTNYAAAKAGILGLTKSLAREVGSRGITVNTVAPGFIDTDMTRVLSSENQEKLNEQIPLGRVGSPQDIAYAVAFLVSPRAAYITGETLHVNGGMYML